MPEGLDPVDNFAGGGLLLNLRQAPDLVKRLQHLGKQLLVDIGVVDPDNIRHQLLARELDVVEDAPAQEGVGKLLFRIGRDNHNRPVVGLHGAACLRDVEFHPVQLPQQVIGKFQVGFVDLIDEQNHLFLVGKRIAQLAQLDILLNVVHALAAKLAVVEALDHIVDVEAVLGLGGGFNVPNNEPFTKGPGNRLSQHGFAGARLPLDQQGFLQHHGNVGRPEQLL